LYSEDTIVSTNDCVYSSSCHVENKHFENVEETNTKTVESYEDFIANLPLPVTEFNKTVRNVFRCLLNCWQSLEIILSVNSMIVRLLEFVFQVINVMVASSQSLPVSGAFHVL
jgi:hypothetical protein